MGSTDICFRIDASNKIGMGHLYESISLAESLEKRGAGKIIFLLNNFLPAVDIVRKAGFNSDLMDDASCLNEIVEAANISSRIKQYKSRVLIVDLLNRSDLYFEKLKPIVEKIAVILDDTGRREIPADMVVNFNICQDEDFYESLAQRKTAYYIGPKYMLHPENMHEYWKKVKYIPEICKTIFINQGGSDPFGLTIKVIKALESLKLKQKIVVVIGPAVLDQHKKEIKQISTGLKNRFQLEWSIGQERMFDLMKESDLAITAAGNTLYELAIFGVPSIVICHHERHNQVASRFAEKKAVVNLGVGLNLNEDNIAETVDRLLGSRETRYLLSVNIKEIVDGLGSKRVAEAVLEL